MKEVNKQVLYVSGGGDESKTLVFDSIFLKNLPGKDILFIPIAKTTRSMNGYRKKCEWIANKLNKHSIHPLNVSMILDLSKCKKIDNFSAVYIGGGNAYKLATVMKKSGFLLLLKKYIKNGGIVYGASAGGIFMGKDISTHNEEKYFLENKKYEYNFTQGMGLIGEYSIMVHFQEENRKHVIEYIKKEGNPVIAIPEGTGLVISGDFASVIGSSGVIIFEKDGDSRIIGPNGVFKI